MAKKAKSRPETKKNPAKTKEGPGINYLAILVYLIAPLIFFNLPKNKAWLKDRIGTYYKNISVESDSLSINFRNAQRQGPAYSVFDFACKNVPKGSRFLMPPQTYYLKMLYDKNNPNQVADLFNFLAEPNLFSYHCMHLVPITLSMDEKTIRSAQYTVFLTPQKSLQIVKIENDETYALVRKTFDLPLQIITDRQIAIDFLNSQ